MHKSQIWTDSLNKATVVTVCFLSLYLDRCVCTRDARYTGNGKIPVYIICKTVRYHHFAQFGISLAAVPKFTTMRHCYPNCRETGGKRDNGETTMDQTGETQSTRPKLINKESGRSEIWHYFAYKSDEKVNQPTLMHQSASAAINHVLPWEATHQILANICHSLILICSRS